MASYIRCPSCGGTFSEDEYKNHSCRDSIYGGAGDLHTEQETAKEGGSGGGRP